jgi:hypothetical protein
MVERKKAPGRFELPQQSASLRSTAPFARRRDACDTRAAPACDPKSSRRGFGVTAVKHALVVTEERGKLRAGCVCGWQALGLDKTNRSCAQAWNGHMYAAGFRTHAQIAAAA